MYWNGRIADLAVIMDSPLLTAKSDGPGFFIMPVWEEL